MKKSIDFISLIGTNKIVLDKELEEHGFVLQDYGNYGEFSYAVYKYQSCVERYINVKFDSKDSGEFANTFIIY